MGLSLENLTDNYFLWFILVLAIIYYGITYPYGYWASKGVPFVRPVPFFGNTFLSAAFIKPRFQEIQYYYNYFSGHPYGGLYEFLTPKLLLRDPELIEQILIKDFSVFMDRGRVTDTKLDPLFNHLVNLSGSKWKSLRTKLTPTFSSGKLKMMFCELEKCADVLLQLLEEKTKKSPGTFEVKKLMAGFTMDVIGSCAFGLELNALHNPNSPFMKLGDGAFKASKMTAIRNMMRTNFPNILTFFGWKAVPKNMENFFINTIKNTVRERQEKHIQRNDFVQLMMEIKKQEECQLNNKENEVLMDDSTFAANAFVFLLAGFETTATTLSYLLYELAKNPQIQKKLHNEVTEVMKKHKGEISWDTVKDMTYLESVVCETLRKHSPVPFIQRGNLKPYKLPKTSLELPVGSKVVIPIQALHYDPKYYPEPEKFNPDRFSEENKQNMVKCTYLPFGDGPRICIGLRFAKIEVKLATIKLISNYEFKLNAKTKDPLMFSAETAFVSPIGGIWIDFVPRK